MWILLRSWLLQDGSFGEFSVGKSYCFALEFEYSLLARLEKTQESVERINLAGSGREYMVESARVVELETHYVQIQVADLDMYRSRVVLKENDPPAIGDLISGRIRLKASPKWESPCPSNRWKIEKLEVIPTQFVHGLVDPVIISSGKDVKQTSKLSDQDYWAYCSKVTRSGPRI